MTTNNGLGNILMDLIMRARNGSGDPEVVNRALMGTREDPSRIAAMAQGGAEGVASGMGSIEDARNFLLPGTAARNQGMPRMEATMRSQPGFPDYQVPEGHPYRPYYAAGKMAPAAALMAPMGAAEGLAGMGLELGTGMGGAAAADYVRQLGGGSGAQTMADMAVGMTPGGAITSLAALPAFLMKGGDTFYGADDMGRLGRAVLEGKHNISTDFIGSGPGGKVKVVDVAGYFQRHRSPIKPGTKDPIELGQFEDRLFEEAKSGLALHPEAVGWYKENVDLMMKVAQEAHPELARPHDQLIFKAALAVTSDGNKVGPNFDNAMEIYNAWRTTGKLDPKLAKGKAVKNIAGNIAKIDRLVNTLGPQGAEQWLAKTGTVKEVRESAQTMLGLSKKEAMKIGLGENVGTVIPYSVMFGPKLGSFYANLNGNYDPLTMDRWFMRTAGRLTGTQLDVKAGALTKSNSQIRSAVDSLTPAQRKLVGITKDMNVEAAHKKANTWMAKNYRLAQQDPGMDKLRLAINARGKVKEPLVEAPTSGTHRAWLRDRLNNVQKRLAADGVKIANADLQAILWYQEKELYKKMGVKPPKADNDFAAAAESYFKRSRGTGSKVYSQGTGKIGTIGRAK